MQQVRRVRNVRRGPGPEHRIQNAIIATLRWRRCAVIRLNSGAIPTKNGGLFRGTKAGTPDLIGYRLKDKKVFFIEVKAPKGRISPAQQMYHLDLMHNHVIHGIARSVEDAVKIVSEGLVGYGYPDCKGA
jgi:phage protein